MKTAKDKYVVVGADFAGYPLKEAVKRHLIERGWTVEDLTPVQDEAPMYHRVGFAVGARIAEKEYERGLIFCGSGMGIHVAAGKVPGVHAAVCESVDSARRCVTANNCNVMAMGSFFTGPRLGMAMADAFLDHHFGQGYEDWEDFDTYHMVGWRECEEFDYEAYKANGFQVDDPATAPLGPQPKGIAF